MATAVVMPKAGISVESCVIGTWRKKVGEVVALGEVLFDYETDKATFECESTAEGTLLEIFYGDGDEVSVLAEVCVIGSEGESVPTAAPVAAVAAVSKRARKLADRFDIDPLTAEPTGPRGRVIERDIIQEARGKRQETRVEADIPSAEIVPKIVNAVQNEYSDEKLSQIRKIISAGMTRSLSEMAQLTHHHSFDATGILNYRQLLKNSGVPELSGITLNDMVLYAVSRSLKAHPSLNAHLLEGEYLRKFSSVHLGVAMDTPRGLIVPTVFNADTKSLAEISAEVKRLSEMAKSGKIDPDLLTGATFTLSNLGNSGIEMFTPIINPPQTAILGVCGICDRVRGGSAGIEIYRSMGLSLTYDHRAVDGAPASRFAAGLCKNLENFVLLLAK